MRPLTIEWVAPDCPPSTCFGPRLAQLTPDPGGFGFMPNGLAGPRIARSKVRFLAEARAIKPRGIFPSAPTRLLRNHSARPPGSSYSSTSASRSRPAVVGGWINWSASRGFLGMVALFLSRYRTCMWPAGRQGRQLGSFSRLPAESTAHPRAVAQSDSARTVRRTGLPWPFRKSAGSAQWPDKYLGEENLRSAVSTRLRFRCQRRRFGKRRCSLFLLKVTPFRVSF